MQSRPRRRAFGLVLALGLLAACGLVSVFGQLAQRHARDVSGMLHVYFRAVEQRDLAGALGYLVPEQRIWWREFVENQLGNHYEIVSISVQSPSLLAQLSGHESGFPTEATLMIAINPGRSDGWRATTRVPLAQAEGRWLMPEPPLKPAE